MHLHSYRQCQPASRCHARAATRRTNDLCPTTLPPLSAVHPRLRSMYSQQRQVNVCRDASSTGSAGVCRRCTVAGRRGHSHPQTPENCDNSTGFIGSMNLIAPTCHTQVHLQHTRGSMSLLLRILRLPSPGAKHICVAGHFLCLPFLQLDLCAGAQLDLSTLSLLSG